VLAGPSCGSPQQTRPCGSEPSKNVHVALVKPAPCKHTLASAAVMFRPQIAHHESVGSVPAAGALPVIPQHVSNASHRSLSASHRCLHCEYFTGNISVSMRGPSLPLAVRQAPAIGTNFRLDGDGGGGDGLGAGLPEAAASSSPSRASALPYRFEKSAKLRIA